VNALNNLLGLFVSSCHSINAKSQKRFKNPIFKLKPIYLNGTISLAQGKAGFVLVFVCWEMVFVGVDYPGWTSLYGVTFLI